MLVSLKFQHKEIKQNHQLEGLQVKLVKLPRGYGQWANSSLLEDKDLSLDEEDGSALILEEGEPSSYHDALVSSEKHEWEEAMHREIQLLLENKTWKLVTLPKDQPLVDSKWVYKLKDNPSEASVSEVRQHGVV